MAKIPMPIKVTPVGPKKSRHARSMAPSDRINDWSHKSVVFAVVGINDRRRVAK